MPKRPKNQLLITKFVEGKEENDEQNILLNEMVRGNLAAFQAQKVCLVLVKRYEAHMLAGDISIEQMQVNVSAKLTSVGTPAESIFRFRGVLNSYLGNPKLSTMTDLERSINREVTADMLKDTVSPKFKPRIRVILESNVVVVSLIAATAIIAASFIFYNLSTWLLSPQQQCYISGHKQFGEKFVHLPDQSIVILSAGSELCSDKDYGVKGRKVFLSGEGYFEVVTNAAQPFYIETDGVLTTVTGTGLNVKNDRGKELVIVSVTHGKVSVCYNDEDYSVMPGYELSIRKQDSTVTLLRFDPSKVNWKYPSLSFNNITLDSTFKKIEQHFHMRVLCSNSVPKQCKFFGEYEYNDVNPDNILNMIGKMYKLEYKIKGDTIFVMGDGNCKGK